MFNVSCVSWANHDNPWGKDLIVTTKNGSFKILIGVRSGGKKHQFLIVITLGKPVFFQQGLLGLF